MPKQIIATSHKGNTLRNEKGRAEFHETCNHCGSWLDHWLYHTNKKSAGKCCVKGCEEEANVGAHVTLPRLPDESAHDYVYIAPMCRGHNANKDGQELTSKPNIQLVYAEQKACKNEHDKRDGEKK